MALAPCEGVPRVIQILAQLPAVLKPAECVSVSSMRLTAALLVREQQLAARQLARSPRFVMVAVLTLAAAVTPSLIFDLVGRAVLPPLPFEEPHELVHVWQRWLGVWSASHLRHYLFRLDAWDAASLLLSLVVAVFLGNSDRARPHPFRGADRSDARSALRVMSLPDSRKD
jgi:hypothetical protein